MSDDELDSLYWAPPKDFTAERTKLTDAAKKRGETAAAKRISSARKPTTAAWIVNRLVLKNKEVPQRLTDLGDRLRAAHAAMDGASIRDLSAEQHRLIDELTRAALAAADMKEASSAVRDDLTGTLQAAIADPEVRARLGRLDRPEQWSGFGAFGDAAPVSTTTRAKKAGGQSEPGSGPAGKSGCDEAARRREKLDAAKRAEAAAERAKADADETLTEWQAERDAARHRRDEALAALRAAERELEGAEERYDKAKQAGNAAAESLKEAKAQVKRA